MASLSDLIIRVGANVDEFLGAMAQVSSKLSDVSDEIESKFEGFEEIGRNLAKFGGILSAAVTVPLVGIGAASLEAAGKMEQFQVGFTTLLHSGTAATAMLNELRDFASHTPFSFPETVQAAQRLMAMGTAAKDVIPHMTAIGNAVSALGGSMD